MLVHVLWVGSARVLAKSPEGQAAKTWPRSELDRGFDDELSCRADVFRLGTWSYLPRTGHDHGISLGRAGRGGMLWAESQARATPALRRPRTVAQARSMNSA